MSVAPWTAHDDGTVTDAEGQYVATFASVEDARTAARTQSLEIWVEALAERWDAAPWDEAWRKEAAHTYHSAADQLRSVLSAWTRAETDDSRDEEGEMYRARVLPDGVD